MHGGGGLLTSVPTVVIDQPLHWLCSVQSLQHALASFSDSTLRSSSLPWSCHGQDEFRRMVAIGSPECLNSGLTKLVCGI